MGVSVGGKYSKTVNIIELLNSVCKLNLHVDELLDKAIHAKEERRHRGAMDRQGEQQKAWTVGREALVIASEESSPTTGDNCLTYTGGSGFYKQ